MKSRCSDIYVTISLPWIVRWTHCGPPNTRLKLKTPLLSTRMASKIIVLHEMSKNYTVEKQFFRSSASRSAAQKVLAKTTTNNYLSTIPSNVLPCFTDGSALANPGPCGAAAVIYPNGMASHPVILRRPVAARSTSYHGELSAIDLALGYTCDYLKANTTRYNIVAIHTDCVSTLQTIQCPQPNSLFSLYNESIKSHTATLMDMDIVTDRLLQRYFL